MRIDQQVAESYSQAVIQWINSTKGRKRSEKYGRSFLVVDGNFELGTMLRPTDFEIGSKDLTRPVQTKALSGVDYVIVRMEEAFSLNVQPNPKSFDEIQRRAIRARTLLREGGCFVLPADESSFGFVNLALRDSGYRVNSSVVAELPTGFKAIRAIK